MGLSDRRRLDVHMKTSDQPRKAIVKRNKFFFSRFFQHFLETTLPTFITGSYFLLSPRRAPGPAYCFFVSLVVRALGILCMDDPIAWLKHVGVGTYSFLTCSTSLSRFVIAGALLRW